MLTTSEAPFIEEARRTGDLFIRQPYELYSQANQQSWQMLYSRMIPRWERYANARFLQGVGSLGLDPERIPRLENVNRFLRPLTGFEALTGAESCILGHPKMQWYIGALSHQPVCFDHQLYVRRLDGDDDVFELKFIADANVAHRTFVERLRRRISVLLENVFL